MKEGHIELMGTLAAIRQSSQKPALVLETEAPITQWLDSIGRLDGIEKVSHSDTYSVTLHISEMDLARSSLLSWALHNQIPVRKLEILQTSLEDLFMEVVSR
ncbi:hypothetical protein D3C73_891280 [compost metagenome]